MVPTIAPKISDEFDDLRNIGWYCSANLLAASTMEPIFDLMDTWFSPKWILLLRFARTSTILIVGRLISGVGVAGGLNGISHLLAIAVPPPVLEKHCNFLMGMSYELSRIGGLFFGAALADSLKWRWCFYLISGFMLLVPIFAIPLLEDSRVVQGRWPNFWKIQHLLAILSSLPTICLLLAMHWGIRDGWGAAKVISLFALAGIYLTFRFLYTWKAGPAELHLLCINITFGASFYPLLYLLRKSTTLVFASIWLQALQVSNTIDGSVMFLPAIATLSVGAILGTSHIIPRTISFMEVLFFYSCVLMAVGSGLLSTLRVDSGQDKRIGYQVLFGLGAGLGASLGVRTAALLETIKNEHRLDNPSTVRRSEVCGGALAIGAAQVVLQTQLLKGAPEVASLLKTGATSFKNSTSPIPPSLLIGYNTALTRAFLVSAAASTLGATVRIVVYITHRLSTRQPPSEYLPRPDELEQE
ncbi:uncharacterized protein BDR25DRAFT_358156 [Lindgomyces ingoldianus]|uniref:Uncharacterized protein n=1 Tax=Lindgomyces ingoldianus TaxID=673940 RepID=A0ACB6QLX1_9PLEO|nr:uncharacterized protein BDR25DRAFT_358156 [Lindgomyces ingoldianus]KAF2467891.1 hypothetical protein BDR25DRAFT_358156 [Lindgomyces ingoldianus]